MNVSTNKTENKSKILADKKATTSQNKKRTTYPSTIQSLR